MPEDLSVYEYSAYVAVTEIGGAHYALVSDRLAVHVVNVTDPGSPAHVASATDGEDGFNLNIPDGIAFADINGTTYAIVNALNSRNLQMIDLSDPANPTAAAGFGGRGADDFAALEFTNVASAEIGGRHYALGAAPYDGKIWIIDVTNPDVLYPTAILAEPWNFPRAVEVMESGGAHYALVADQLSSKVVYLAVVNVTDPARPYIVANVTGDKDDFSASGLPTSISVMESGGAVYALITSTGMMVIDVTDPANPFNALQPYLKLDLEGGRAVYAGQEDGSHSLTFRYLTTPDDHTVDLSYEGTGALRLGRAVLTYADDGVPVPTELPEPGKPDSLSHEKQIRVYGTDPGTHFVTTWEVASRNGSVAIPDGGAGGPYTAYWGDGEKDPPPPGDRSHEYAEAGRYTVAVSEGIPRIKLGGDAANAANLRSIDQWGSTMWAGMADAFRGASGMTLAAGDAPDLSGVDSTAHMFRDSSINADLSGWNVSGVTDMSSMFRGAASFDGDVSNWNVSGVTDMSSMFHGAASFNQDVSGWDVSGVTDATSMFRGAASFNGDVSGWDASGVTDATSMFRGAASFNQDLSGWDVSGVKDTSSMFQGAESFDASLSRWNVSGVTDMSSMFDGAASFEQNLGEWYVTVDDASIGGADVPGIVGTILAQNAFLDGQDPVYGIGAGADSEHFAVVGENRLAMASLDGARTYVANVTASGPKVFEDGNNWATVTVSVQGAPPSTPLSVDAGIHQNVNEGDAVTLAGIVAGALPNALTYAWVQTSPESPQASLDDAASRTVTFEAPQVNKTTTFAFTLTATAGTDSASDLVTVTVIDDAPGPAGLAVHAEARHDAYEGDPVTLSGTAAGVPSSALTYMWAQTSPASPRVLFDDASARTATFEAPRVDVPTTFAFTLTATDFTRGFTGPIRSQTP